mmetsp:Transcript_23079/g.57050  ORF Transcript_23079/g.57050 Transcript_23079/m.57050 type:complete len:174 (+) Transcript_23079:10-531(+)
MECMCVYRRRTHSRLSVYPGQSITQEQQPHTQTGAVTASLSSSSVRQLCVSPPLIHPLTSPAASSSHPFIHPSLAHSSLICFRGSRLAGVSGGVVVRNTVADALSKVNGDRHLASCSVFEISSGTTPCRHIIFSSAARRFSLKVGANTNRRSALDLVGLSRPAVFGLSGGTPL